jgi:hypothetical protein
MDSAGNSMTITSLYPVQTAPATADSLSSRPKSAAPVLVPESLQNSLQNTQDDLAGDKQDDLRVMTVVALQKKCREKGVSANGTKLGLFSHR